MNIGIRQVLHARKLQRVGITLWRLNQMELLLLGALVKIAA